MSVSRRFARPGAGFLVVVLAGAARIDAGVIGTYQFTSNTNATPGAGYAHMAPAAMARGGVVSVANTPEFNSRNWSDASALDTGKYAGFTVTADPGYRFTFDSVSFDYRRLDQNGGHNGPTSLAVRYSTDNFASVGGTSSTLSPVNNALASGSYDPVDVTTAAGGTVSVRFYGWGAPANKQNGQLSLDNVQINGHLTALPRMAATVAGMPSRVMLGAPGVQSLQVVNTDVRAPSESQDVLAFAIGASGSASGSLSHAALAPGESTSSGITFDTASTGVKSGTLTITSSNAYLPTINGLQTASQNFGYAVVTDRVITASAVNFGVVHKDEIIGGVSTLSTTGDDSSRTRVTVSASSATDGVLTAATGAAMLFDHAGASATRSLGGSFATTGNKAGSISLAVTGEGLVGETVGGVSVAYTATVNDYASPSFSSGGGHGAFGGAGNAFTWDFGTVLFNTGSYHANFRALNAYLSDFQDLLSGNYTVTGGAGFSYTNAAIAGLGATIENDGRHVLGVAFDSTQAPGAYQQVFTLTPSSDNLSGSTALAPITLTVEGTILVPEPLSLAVLFTGSLGLFQRRRR